MTDDQFLRECAAKFAPLAHVPEVKEHIDRLNAIADKVAEPEQPEVVPDHVRAKQLAQQIESGNLHGAYEAAALLKRWPRFVSVGLHAMPGGEDAMLYREVISK